MKIRKFNEINNNDIFDGEEWEDEEIDENIKYWIVDYYSFSRINDGELVWFKLEYIESSIGKLKDYIINQGYHKTNYSGFNYIGKDGAIKYRLYINKKFKKL